MNNFDKFLFVMVSCLVVTVGAMMIDFLGFYA
jgi:hypothetical protein